MFWRLVDTRAIVQERETTLTKEMRVWQPDILPTLLKG